MDGTGVEELGKESALRISEAEAAMTSDKGLDRAKARRSFQKRKCCPLGTSSARDSILRSENSSSDAFLGLNCIFLSHRI